MHDPYALTSPFAVIMHDLYAAGRPRHLLVQASASAAGQSESPGA
jgi:hypothetical protein